MTRSTRLTIVGAIAVVAVGAGVALAIDGSSSPQISSAAGSPPSEVVAAINNLDATDQPAAIADLGAGTDITTSAGTTTVWSYTTQGSLPAMALDTNGHVVVGGCNNNETVVQSCSMQLSGTFEEVIGTLQPQVAELTATMPSGTVVRASINGAIWALELPSPGSETATPIAPSAITATDAGGNVVASSDTQAIRTEANGDVASVAALIASRKAAGLPAAITPYP